MDNLTVSQPQVTIPRKNFLKTPLGIILTVAALLAVSLSLWFVSVPQKKMVKNQLTKELAEKLKLSCPVSKEYCPQGKIKKYQGNPALVYKISSGSGVLASTNVNHSEQLELFQNTEAKIKTLYTAVESGGSCYIISYAVPLESKFNELTAPIKEGQALATINGKGILVEKEEANLIVMIRKFAQPTTPCFIKGNELRESAPFIPLTSETIGGIPL